MRATPLHFFAVAAVLAGGATARSCSGCAGQACKGDSGSQTHIASSTASSSTGTPTTTSYLASSTVIGASSMSTSSTTTPAGATTTNTATSTSAATIVVPAYVYPDTNSTWSPLYEAFALRPDVSFIVIVNPDSGPGSTTTPDENYSSAIEQLNGYANVQTVGYVHTSYATRSIDDVLADVETYAGWSSASSSLAMHGIFFDEAPSEYDATLVQYMHTIDAYVKNSTGLQGAKTVIHNPGTICNSSYSGPNTDFSIIFENDYASWTGGLEADVAALPTDRNAYGIMMYSVPEWSSSTSSEVTSVVDTMSQYASYIFATSLTVDYYSSWASDWLDFVAQVPS